MKHVLSDEDILQVIKQSWDPTVDYLMLSRFSPSLSHPVRFLKQRWRACNFNFFFRRPFPFSALPSDIRFTVCVDFALLHLWL